jgi:hypothetical protein
MCLLCEYYGSPHQGLSSQTYFGMVTPAQGFTQLPIQ